MSGRYKRLKDDKLFKPESAFDIIGKECKSILGYAEKRSQRKPNPQSRSILPKLLDRFERKFPGEKQGVVNQAFFDVVIGTSPDSPFVIDDEVDSNTLQRWSAEVKAAGTGRSSFSKKRPPGSYTVKRKTPVIASSEAIVRAAGKPTPAGAAGVDETDSKFTDWLENTYNNSDRHALGMKILSKLFGSGKITDREDYNLDRTSRPFFTYWMTLVQIIIFIVVVATYGFAPYGVSPRTISQELLTRELYVRNIEILEQTSMWGGPKQADLIHVGSRFAPCMRPDNNIQVLLDAYKDVERTTACCVNTDGSGCAQLKESECSDYLAIWQSWAKPPVMRDIMRSSGSVCGQDPLYCSKPSSSPPNTWPDDITQWPVCLETHNGTASSEDIHMTCELIARPCCVGLQGQCEMTTREVCEFKSGYFHEDAYLCSQVSCLDDVCGMIPFNDPNVPDQAYRLFANMFLHAGILDLLITILFQLFFLRELEKLISTWRVLLLYFGSGVVGSLASAIFMPYYVETGPSGAQFGIIAAMGLELVRYERLENKSRGSAGDFGWCSPMAKTAYKLLGLMLFLLVIGFLLPQIDNYAHVFGFIFGLLLAFGLRPFKLMCGRDFTKKDMKPYLYIIMASCLLVAVALMVILFLVFYLVDVINCESCVYFNCIPFTDTYCDDVRISYSLDDL